MYAKRWAYPSSSKEKRTVSSASLGTTGTKSSVAVAGRGDGVEVISAVCGIVPREQLRMRSPIRMMIVVSAKERCIVLDM
jgi:hypothetical protein